MKINKINLKIKSDEDQEGGIIEHASLVFLGKRRAGKTTGIFGFFKVNPGYFPTGTIISPTAMHDKDMLKHFPCCFIHKEYSDDLIISIMERQLNIKREYISRGGKKSGINPNSFIILDDCAFDDTWKKSKYMSEVLMNGRHYYLTVIITTQDPMAIPPRIRGNMEYIFICKETKETNIRKIYEHYVSVFPVLKSFKKALTKIAQDYTLMVVDNVTSSADINKQVFYYKANLKDPDFSNFRVTSDRFWKMNDKVLASNSINLNNNNNNESEIEKIYEDDTNYNDDDEYGGNGGDGGNDRYGGNGGNGGDHYNPNFPKTMDEFMF
jgi:hypothetical protein